MKIWQIGSIVNLVAMAMVCLVAFCSADTCPLIECSSGMVPMKCHWAFLAEGWIAGAGVVGGIVAILAKTKEGRRTVAIMMVALSLVCIFVLTPLGVGICAHDDSACHLPAYAIWVLSALVLVVSIVQIVRCNPDAERLPKMTL